ncbi:MAG TPA: uroporphyrinogen-III C-methyltransferase [Aeromicrobium sp.]|nr:uroporphyrinogen-III C-methyltransferase [Aeromicrobium sp.]
MTGLPLTLQLANRKVVVVGGGKVATRRVFTFVEAGANVQVISPAVSQSLASAIGRGEVSWTDRGYQTGDLADAWLVQTATGIAAVDDQVFADAEANQIFCLKGGDPQKATAWAPAVAQVGDVTIAISGGGDAKRATALRDEVAAALHTGELPLRHRTHRKGQVALVGGGPGDAGLITARGRQLLASADVVVIDRLAPQSVLSELADDVEVIDVGKQPDHHPIPQEQINEILIEHAKAGKMVVRLKGGDPYVFGRGGEELIACREAGVEVEVVPGVTSAIAVAAAAGIPVTHRGISRGFSVVTGHEELASLPRRSDHTIVLLMGVKRLGQTVAEMIAAGHDEQTPVAVIERGFSPTQKTTIGTLATIAELASEAKSPAVVVIGDVVRLAPTID